MRTPGVALALLFTIALGVGSNVCIQGFVAGLTKPAAALTSVDRVVSVFGRVGQGEGGPLSYQEYLSLKSRRDVFEWIGAAHVWPCAIESAGQADTVATAAITSNLAGLLNLPLDGGVVISYRMWQNQFGAKANVRGDSIRIAGAGARVSGVAPDWLDGVYRDRAVDLWIPLREEDLRGADHASRNLWVVGRLRHNVSRSQAQTAIGPGGVSGEARVLSYTGMMPEMASGLARIGTLLGFAAGAVFLIACANVACFLLGRAFARSHEISLRVTLGASRRQLAGELLSDSIVISVAGGALGMLLAVWTSRVIPALLFEQDAARLVFAPDLAGIVLASSACVGITIGCGLLPAMAIPYDRPATVLRRESAGPSKAIRRLRAGLVVGQMASCCVLAISTAFLADGLRTALQTSAGHRLGHTILATVQPHVDVGVDIGYFERVERAVKSMAGVSAIAWAGRLPGSQPEWQSLRIEPRRLPMREVQMDVASFTTGSLNLFVLPPKAGRMFGVADGACRVAIVNESAAAELFGDSTAGRTVEDMSGRPVEIIGVAAMRQAELAAKGNPPTIYFYHPDDTAPPDRIAAARFRAPIAVKLAGAELDANVVSAEYFRAMGLSPAAGQGFDQPTPGGCRVAVINQDAADLYFGGQAVGAAVIDDRGRRTGIIGVVRSSRLGTFQRRAEPAIYFPMRQDTLFRMTLIANAKEVNDALLAELRRKIASVPGGSGATAVVKTLETHLKQTALAPLRIAAAIMGASAAAGLLLSLLGLYGALSDAARQRRRELAVRIALGAQRWRVIGQVLGEGGRLACGGAAAGILGSLGLSRLLARIIPVGGSPALWVWLAAPLVLAGAVAVAGVLPARRALMVNPLTIMRDDN